MNEKGEKIASKTTKLSESIKYSEGDEHISIPSGTSQSVTFKVKAKDLTNSISVKIVKIGNDFLEDIIRRDKISIKRDPDLSDREQSKIGITQKNGTITNYSGQTKNVIIPEGKDNLTITGIGEKAFEGKQLLKIFIPDSINTIKERAFYNNYLTTITIPKNINSIGKWAFAKNQLVEVVIPSNIKTIGNWAFFRNKIKKITIPGDVVLENNCFDNKFTDYYQKNGRSNGIYTFNNGEWKKN
jgi:hypothetical protein